MVNQSKIASKSSLNCTVVKNKSSLMLLSALLLKIIVIMSDVFVCDLQVRYPLSPATLCTRTRRKLAGRLLLTGLFTLC